MVRSQERCEKMWGQGVSNVRRACALCAAALAPPASRSPQEISPILTSFSSESSSERARMDGDLEDPDSEEQSEVRGMLLVN
jgi:hypothetical protein